MQHESNHRPPACTWNGTAAQYLMGTLLGDSLREFLEHLEEGCVECSDELSESRQALALLDAAEMERPEAQAEPPAGLLGNLRSRLHGGVRPSEAAGIQTWREWEGQPPADRRTGLFTLHAHEGLWQPIALPGIRVRQLAVDEERRLVTMMIRMDPGTSYPPHRHAAAEECYVLEGELHVGESVLRAGDYQRAEVGSIHGVQWTETGCTLLLVSSQDDELVA